MVVFFICYTKGVRGVIVIVTFRNIPRLAKYCVHVCGLHFDATTNFFRARIGSTKPSY